MKDIQSGGIFQRNFSQKLENIFQIPIFYLNGNFLLNAEGNMGKKKSSKVFLYLLYFNNFNFILQKVMKNDVI